MGWVQRTFGRSPAARLERAQHFMGRGRYNDARLELEGLDGEEAEAMLAEARGVLAQWNLEESEARFRSGDAVGAQEHIALAQTFGATDEQVRATRRIGRELRAEARREAQAVKAEAQAAAQEQMGGDDPLWRLPPDHPRLRYAVLVEGYPEGLRGRLVGLGGDFAAAVMLLEEGKADDAWTAMAAFTSQDPVARYERARAALAAGRLPAAASDLLTFGQEIGHQRIGNNHTASMLAGVMGRLGRAAEALVIIDAEIVAAPQELELQAVRVGLLEATGTLDEAEAAASALLQKAPRQMGLYRQLARIRERRGERGAAAQVLEWGLDTCCSSPGKCGNQPLDVQAVRALARLYLEDRVSPERTAELLKQLGQHVEQPSWDDGYLVALAARNQLDPRAEQMAQRLVESLPEADPRRAVVAQAFSLA
ncbi:MAG: tetratricopeptide (TPR) repeat protein [Myxococcota bacterium]|jgi:tetratricopeptide (TPR) repeat protein